MSNVKLKMTNDKKNLNTKMTNVKLQTNIFGQDGKEAGKVELPAKIFSVKWNANLVHQVMVSMQSNARETVADTKGRGEVSGGGKKPWQQKGTGRARHGSSRSPIWKGGGVTHGPTSEINYKRKINKKMKLKALFAILSAKLKDNEIIMLEDFKLSSPKVKVAQDVLANLAKNGFEKINYKIGKRVIIATPELDENMQKSFRNIKSATVEEVRNLNPLSLLNYKYVVFVSPKESLEQLEARVKS
jgi:large subunit ribosomal protein L4